VGVFSILHWNNAENNDLNSTQELQKAAFSHTPWRNLWQIRSLSRLCTQYNYIFSLN